MNNAVSLYFHIPFCVKKCNYCNFCSIPSPSETVVEAYKNALTAQLDSFKNEFGERNVATVYFGGGTPTFMKETQLAQILDRASKVFHFASDCEITLEANPKTVNEKQLAFLRDSGFNRLSLGLQSSDNKMSAFLGRIGTTEDFSETYLSAREAGFNNISVDIIFALPNINNTTSKEVLIRDLTFVKSLNTEHISVYALSVEKGTPLAKKQHTLVFPNEDEQVEMYFEICSQLRNAGYEHYEISNFAVNKARSNHNLGYWQRREYIGFGAAAHSFFNNKRFSSKFDINDFIKSAASVPYSRSASTAGAQTITDFEAEEERIMLGLRISDGIPYVNKKKAKFIEKLVAEGYADYVDGVLSLTEKGFFVSNTIIGGLLN